MQPDSPISGMIPVGAPSDDVPSSVTTVARDTLMAQLTALLQSGELATAIDYWKDLLIKTPSDPALIAQLDKVTAFLNNRGIALYRQDQIDESLSYFLLALRARANCAPALNNAATCLKELGRLDESTAAYQQALAMQPHLVDAHSNLLLNMQYKSGITAKELVAAHYAWDECHGASVHKTPTNYANTPESDRALHVGLLSPDLGQHPVGIFLVRYLENADPTQILFHAYATMRLAGPLHERIHRAVPYWHDVQDLNDEALATKIQTDGIDILVDLSGHAANNRLGVLARKPAPIQMTWIGYPGDTGLSAVDYVIGDRFVLPETMQPHMPSKILHLQNGFLCFDPPMDAPPVAALPATMPGAVTFAAFHNPAKCGPNVIKLWVEILNRLPQSRLLLKYKGFGTTSTQKRVQEQFAVHGIDASRLEFQGASPLPEMFAAMNRTNIALDTFPFSGGLMSCYMLWMGLPLITLPGESFASRQGLCFLSLMGMTETIATNPQDYIEKAVALAEDLPRLAELRKRVRPAMESSPLCDGKRAMADLQNLLRKAWRDWCASI